jgi:preprotein translocase subunit SecB
MKNIATSAAFSFLSHQVNKFSYTNPLTDESNVDIEFQLSGILKNAENIYILTIEFNATYGDDSKVFSNIVSEGVFTFAEPVQIDTIPDYFYANSIAILFPYLRAFITTLTAVANIKPLILPTLNLGSLAKPLKDNTTSQ